MRTRRFFAGMIDIILLVAIAIAPIWYSLVNLRDLMASPVGEPPSLLMLITFIWAAAVLLFYFPIFESSSLQATPGKLIMSLKVVQANGQSLTHMQAIYRALFGPRRRHCPPVTLSPSG